MSYLDYSLEIRVDADDYIAGKADLMSAVITLKDGNRVVETMRVFSPPVTDEAGVKNLFRSMFGNMFHLSWRRRPMSRYHTGDFVRVIGDSAGHGFPAGSIICLRKVDEDPAFDECSDVTWLAEGFTTALGTAGERWIGEDDFTSLILIPDEEGKNK